ncbi:hypothetical protein [Pedobacter punctiformis]|uniref:Uncharacterized protein n=1 Tax=Pedobacter punctiformis TaxID=3004097 RepID=A0ABT4LC86_9SPHI|nr:hypothetical protein [Pedobacter sp. HCMS5-2]MCZ4245327.1 hypothetical protein [Pedobacter sp. HCMS5-2]
MIYKLNSPLKPNLSLFLLILLIILNSCKKDNLGKEKLSNNELTALKEWQSKNFDQKSILFSSMVPNWNNIYVNELKDKIVYEVDLTSTDNAFITNGFLSKSDKNNYLAKSRFKLLLFKDSKTGQITDGYYMTSLSDEPVHYTQVNNFTGYIYFYNRKGNFVNGWIFDAGKALQAISQGTETGYRESVNAGLKEKINMNDFGNGRIQVSAQQFCYTGQTPIYGESCIQPEGSQAPVCSTYIKGYNYTRFCVDVEIPTDGTGGLIPDPNNPRGQQPVPGTLPTAPDDGTPPKNYGTDPNCLNCQVPNSVFDQLVADAVASGLTVSPPKPNTVLTTPDGVTYLGTITEIRDASGNLVASFFTPNATAGPFTTGYQYSIGNKGPDGTGNPNNYTPIFYSPSGEPIIFNTPPLLTGGGGTVTYDFLDEFYSDEAINASDINLNLPALALPVFTSNGYNIFTSNRIQSDTYTESHPVSQKIIAYNPWIYRAFIGANNTSVKYFHLVSKGLAGKDGYGKSIGAIGEGLFAQRVTTEYPTSPGGNMRIGYWAGSTHIDALQEHFLPKVGGMYYGIMINYTDIDGNPKQQKMEYPDLNHNTSMEIGRIAYEVKTLNVNKNSVETLYATFQEGVNQTVHRSKINGVNASVLVFDYNCWMKLMSSSYRQSVLNTISNIYSIKNSSNEQVIFIRIEKNLWQDSNKAYFDLIDKIKDL